MTHTVYFDTSFYVQLERTRNRDKIDLALGVISALRDRGIRRVESMELVVELSKGTDLDGKKYLIDLLYHWDPAPLRIAGANIAFICYSDENLRPLRAFVEMKSELAALCAHARIPSTVSATTSTPEEDLQSAREAASLVAILELVIRNEVTPLDPDLRQLAETSLADVKTLMGADPKTIHEWLGNYIQAVENTRPGSLHQATIQKKVLAGNPRASKVAQGVASENIKKGHHSTILDLDHLSVFQRNLDLIDWMMMDTRVLAALDTQAAPQVRPFRHRIFSAGLDNVIPTLDALGRNETR